MFTFKIKYLLWAVLIFIVEVLIALYVHDRIVRPYIGDYLVVMLIYCVLKAFVDIPNKKAALLVLLFAYSVEIAQYFKVVELLGLQDVKLARIVIGVSFEWLDMLAYTLGVLTILIIDRPALKLNKSTQ